MTGPEHYSQAEKLLAGLDDLGDALANLRGMDPPSAVAALRLVVDQAQVHATLAVAEQLAQLIQFSLDEATP